jgi:hypothetical protein
MCYSREAGEAADVKQTANRAAAGHREEMPRMRENLTRRPRRDAAPSFTVTE